MPQINLNSSIDTTGWNNKVNRIDEPLFWRNDSIYSHGGLNRLSHLSMDGSGTLTRDLKLISFDDNRVLINGQQIIDYGEAEKISYPEQLQADAALVDDNLLYIANFIDSSNVQIHVYVVDPEGTQTLSQDYIISVYPNASKYCKLLLKNGAISVLQITPSGFCINGSNFTIPVGNTAQFIAHPNGWDVVVNRTVRLLDITNGTFEFIPNAVDARVIEDTVYYTFMGDVVNQYATRPINDTVLTNVQFSKPSGTGTARIYSQTYHPISPFTILTDNRYYWWARSDGYDYLEVNSDEADEPTYAPTTDYVRSTDGLTSELTSQFNRTFNPISKIEEVYQQGNFLVLGYDGLIIAPTTFTEYYATFDDANNFTQVVVRNSNDIYHFIISRQIPLQIQQVGRDLYKINVIDINNLFNSTTEQAYPGSLDWNNRVVPEQVLRLFNQVVQVFPSQSVVFNSAYGGNYEAGGEISTSILTGSYHISLSSPGSRRMLAPDASRPSVWEEVNPNLRSIIDYYYSVGLTTAAYQTTGFNSTKSELTGLDYPEPALSMILLPSPINSLFSPNNLGISYQQWGTYLNIGIQYDFKFIDSYPLTSAVNKAGQIFSISGATYLYDGEVIWQIDFSNSQFNGRTFIVDTGAMRFIGSDSVKALFWCSDGWIYQFTGSYQLSAAYSFTRVLWEEGPLEIAGYCQETDEWILGFNHTTYRIRKNIITTLHQRISGLVATRSGNAFLFNDSENILKWNLLEPLLDADEYNNYLDTGYLGLEEGDEVAFTRVWLKIEGTFKAYTYVLKDKIIESSDIQFTNVDEAVIVPKGTSGRAIRLVLDGQFHLKAITIDYTKQGKAPSLTGRSK